MEIRHLFYAWFCTNMLGNLLEFIDIVPGISRLQCRWAVKAGDESTRTEIRWVRLFCSLHHWHILSLQACGPASFIPSFVYFLKFSWYNKLFGAWNCLPTYICSLSRPIYVWSGDLGREALAESWQHSWIRDNKESVWWQWKQQGFCKSGFSNSRVCFLGNSGVHDTLFIIHSRSHVQSELVAAARHRHVLFSFDTAQNHLTILLKLDGKKETQHTQRRFASLFLSICSQKYF